MPRSAEVDGAAAERKEERKNKYKTERRPEVPRYLNIAPLVLQRFRRWGMEGSEYLQKLAKTQLTRWKSNSADFIDFGDRSFLNPKM